MNFIILNIYVIFFFALQKTSVAASSTIYQLSQNPDKQEILFKEIKASLPDKNTPFNINMLERMPYLRACIKETLRYILLSFLNVYYFVLCLSCFMTLFVIIFLECIQLLLEMVETYNQMLLFLVIMCQKE